MFHFQAFSNQLFRPQPPADVNLVYGDLRDETMPRLLLDMLLKADEGLAVAAHLLPRQTHHCNKDRLNRHLPMQRSIA